MAGLEKYSFEAELQRDHVGRVSFREEVEAIAMPRREAEDVKVQEPTV